MSDTPPLDFSENLVDPTEYIGGDREDRNSADVPANRLPVS